ncbi:predicted protein [Uncinocarpus reesii 1704]|uniref:Uncharacterized protein n=1 Tax=Uncinocarpus reesii (strain UAMH 1704) TaxID=336963 RepID=C4JK65_UNCRE|nr:uncharacterized protein UREG_02022 [Uncinocarpus reesii 1704]EEP77173.1 predicted protein [Uncinocarpus reesii 1704]
MAKMANAMRLGTSRTMLRAHARLIEFILAPSDRWSDGGRRRELGVGGGGPVVRGEASSWIFPGMTPMSAAKVTSVEAGRAFDGKTVVRIARSRDGNSLSVKRYFWSAWERSLFRQRTFSQSDENSCQEIKRIENVNTAGMPR